MTTWDQADCAQNFQHRYLRLNVFSRQRLRYRVNGGRVGQYVRSPVRIVHQRLQTSYHARVQIAVRCFRVHCSKDLQQSVQSIQLYESQDETVRLRSQSGLQGFGLAHLVRDFLALFRKRTASYRPQPVDVIFRIPAQVGGPEPTVLQRAVAFSGAVYLPLFVGRKCRTACRLAWVRSNSSTNSRNILFNSSSAGIGRVGVIA